MSQTSKVRKAVIPVAGLGTRMLPASKAIPKEMLPIADKPIIQYVVNEIIAAGIKEIILVTHSSKNSIENHFDKSFELESILEKRVKRQLLEEVQAICPKDVTIMHVRQGTAMGLGHAIACARPLVGNHPFAVVLPDVMINDYDCNLKQDNLAEMVKMFDETKASQIMVDGVPEQDVDKYGITDVGGENMQPGDSKPIKGMVEKPSVEDAPSNLAVVGRYVLSAEIWDILEKTPIGAGGEIQLTDAIATLMNWEPVNAYLMKGTYHDCGDKFGYMKAFVEYSMRHPHLGEAFTQFVKSH
jgi:UTP--glucose-1-phosphate uridylyltransferase